MTVTTTTPPRRRGLPYVGQTIAYVRDPLAMMRGQYDRFGAVSEMDFIGKRWTALLGPDACDVALRNADKAFASGDGWGYLVGPFFDRGLMLLDFEEHHRHRRIMQSAFTRDHLERYTEALQPAVVAGLDQWEPGNGFRAYPALKSLTLDLATTVFMGGADLATPDELDRVNRAFIDCVQSATALLRLNIPGTRWGRALRGRTLLEEFFGRHLAEKRANPGTDLFSVLCQVTTEDGETFSDEDIVNHMIFLLMAAHDTSTITVSTMMQHLGQHPEWQQRCRDEAMALPEHPSLADLDGLTAIDLVMKESLRLVPPVPVLARKTVKDTEVLGHHIPADRLVVVMLHLSHHMEELWPDPERFDPERFADDRREDKVHRHAWEPFGGGVHKCIGMFFAGAEVKTILVHLLRRFTWTVDPDYAAPMNYQSLPFPKDGQPIHLTPL
ncbi:cytochrome P450 [Aeromicrobium sp. A1-2]|uniref:cytochrome P450 n=1 Tax=Aeromicrobium sp. A1-2 TaxID=2107713 RepID=UPI000E4B76A3|nr:cytochrome P450 [Aeromicrobium sp. A1-2]AXT86527.1 cytochrome P450 [Aeromicrobium sp. A1-2]